MLAIECCILFQSLAVLGKNDFWWQLVLDEGILSESGFWCLVNEVVESRVLNSRWSSKWRSTLLWMNVNDHLKTCDLLHLRSSRWLCEWSAKGLWKGLKLRKALPLTLPDTSWGHTAQFLSFEEWVSLSTLPDITGRAALAVQPDVLNAKYYVITNATYSCHNCDPVPGKFKHVTNIETCMLLCCDYITLWKAVDANMVENVYQPLPMLISSMQVSFTVGSIFSLTGICFRMKFQTIFPQNLA